MAKLYRVFWALEQL